MSQLKIIQPETKKLVSKLRFKVNKRRTFGNPEGPQGRHNKIKKTLTALLKHERIELNYHLGDEVRGYTERLISDAIRYGDCHKTTMEMASYWIIEKQLVHKLFKVLAPRYQNSPLSYTKMWRAPYNYPSQYAKCVLELRNNVYPPLGLEKTNNKNLIHNILLSEAKKDYQREKALKAQQQSESDKTETTESSSESKESIIDILAASDNLSSELPEGDGNEESVKVESKSDDNAETVKMSEAEEKDFSNEKSVKLDSQLQDDLNLDKMNLKEPEEKELPPKEK